jgi:hypothetical chaperone protein
MTSKPEIYALDFGTTNSLIAAASRDRVYRALAVDEHAKDPTIFRSILHFAADGSTTFGSRALERYAESGMQGRLVRSLKRHLPSKSFVGTEANGRHYRLEELIGGVLRNLRQRANELFDADVVRVLLGRPARFSPDPELDELAERRLVSAAHLAGFETVELCPEPIAAAHDFQRYLDEPRLVLIADLGGGTSDFSLIRMSHHGYRPEDVLSTSGVGVAGDALDSSLMRARIADCFGANVRYRAPFGKNELTMPLALVHRLYSPVDLSLLSERHVLEFLTRVRDLGVSDADRAGAERLLIVAEDALGFQIYEAIEHCKRVLAKAPSGDRARPDSTQFVFDYPEVEVNRVISRQDFEAAVTPPIEEIFDTLRNMLARAGVRPENVEVVCSTGGTSRVGLITQRLGEMFEHARFHRLSSFRAVVDGLAERARSRLI